MLKEEIRVFFNLFIPVRCRLYESTGLSVDDSSASVSRVSGQCPGAGHALEVRKDFLSEIGFGARGEVNAGEWRSVEGCMRRFRKVSGHFTNIRILGQGDR